MATTKDASSDEAERQCERRKQELAHAEQEGHREEVDHIDQRRGQDREIDFRSALLRGHRGRRPISRWR